jgi:hypothetical protein
MRICGQCGESATYGGYGYIPGQEIKEMCCLNCLLWDVKDFNRAQGKPEPKNVLIVRPDDVDKPLT